jgi:uncharacterized membrane protein
VKNYFRKFRKDNIKDALTYKPSGALSAGMLFINILKRVYLSEKEAMALNWKGSHHLKREIAGWVEEKIITEEQAAVLRRKYELDREAPWYLRSGFILKAVAAVLVGSGLFLLISENWHHFPLLVRFSFGMVPLLVLYALGFRFASRHHRNAAELTFFLASIVFGLNIFLQAQIFHLSSYYPNGVLWWIIGALPVALYFRSSLHNYLVQGLFALWLALQLQYDQFSLWAPVLFAGMAYLALLHANPYQFALLLLNTYLLVFSLHGFVYSDSEPDPVLLFGSLTLLLVHLLPRLIHFFPKVPLPLFTGLGLFVLFALGYLTSFDDFLHDLIRRDVSAFTYLFFLAALLLAWRQRPEPLRYWVTGLMGLLIAVHAGGQYGVGEEDGYAKAAALLMNLFLLAHIAWRIWYGLQHQLKPYFMGGVFLLLLLAGSRYLDFFDNYLVAAAIFMACGLLLLFVNHFWNKRYAV